MKKMLMLSVMIACLQATYAQDPITLIIQEGIKKVIVAVDLKIQRLQNETIWLQNAEKEIENKLSALRLGEISDWVERQRQLYADYFDELRRVKSVISTYYKVQSVVNKQVMLLKEYKAAWQLFRDDEHFTPDELQVMEKVYASMLAGAGKNIERLMLVVQAFSLQMTDAARLEMIASVDEDLGRQLTAMRAFTGQNRVLALQRAMEAGDVDIARRLYGLQ